LYDSKTGQVTNLPGPTGLITDSGRVYGSGYQLVGWAPHLYSSQNGAVQDLGTPSAATGVSVMASNNSGQVLVNAFMGSGQGGAFLYSGGKWTALPNFVAAAMNAQGALAGSTSTNALGNAQAAVISSSGALINIGTLPGDAYATATGINSHGQVVGFSMQNADLDPTARAFLYQNGVMTSLNSLMAGSGWNIQRAWSINDLGQILATGTNGNSQDTLLLTPSNLPTPPNPVFPEMPVPEPSTFLVFGFLAAVAWRICPRSAFPGPSA